MTNRRRCAERSGVARKGAATVSGPGRFRYSGGRNREPRQPRQDEGISGKLIERKLGSVFRRAYDQKIPNSKLQTPEKFQIRSTKGLFILTGQSGRQNGGT